MYVNETIESIKSTHCEHVCFQGSNSVVLFIIKNNYCSCSSRFGTRIVSTVILTNYERTHKATSRQSVWYRFYWQSKIRPPNVHLLALSHICLMLNSTLNLNFIYLHDCYTDSIFETNLLLGTEYYFTLDDSAGHAHKKASLLLMHVASWSCTWNDLTHL